MNLQTIADIAGLQIVYTVEYSFVTGKNVAKYNQLQSAKEFAETEKSVVIAQFWDDTRKAYVIPSDALAMARGIINGLQTNEVKAALEFAVE